MPLYNSLRTNLRGALNIDDPKEIDDAVHLNQMVVEMEINRVFCLVQDTTVPHDAGEDVTIREQRPFRDADTVALHLAVFGPLVESAHKSVDLESKSPSLRILVVKSEEVDVFVFAYVLPLSEGLVQDADFREVLSNDGEQCGFATADVALDGDEMRLVHIFWRHAPILN